MANQGRINFTVGFNIDQSSLNQLKSSLANLQNLKAQDLVGIDSKKSTQELEKIKASAKQVEAALQASFNPALNTYNIDAFKKKLESSGTSLKQLNAEWSSIGARGSAAFRDLATAITSTKLPLQETHNLLKSMGTTLMNTIKWSIASNAINTVTGSVQKAWGFTKELDKSLNDIMIVTDKSSASMEKFARQANRAAKELGKSTTDYTKASLIYYQQGLNDAEVKARTETTLKAANITGQNADAVSEQLTAVWNGYKVSAQETEMYIDKLSAVAATTAADLEELSTGMSKVASAANNMGVDIDQLNGMLATTISVTRQAPESVGTAFKTIFARITDIEAGISEDATLGEYTSQMKTLGFNVLDANGKLRDMGDVIEEIGGKWQTLTREQQVSLAQTMAGTRQYNNLLALFENWDMYTQSLQTSANATGMLQKQQEEYMESIEAHLEQLGTAGERVYDAIFDAESMKDLIDALTEGVELVGNFVESIGGGGNLLMALVPVMTRLFSGSIAEGIAKTVTNFQNAKNTTASLKGLLENIQSIDITKDYDKQLQSFREELVLLRQQGILTNEEFNELTDQIKEFANAANEYELRTERLSPTNLKARMLDLQDKGFGGATPLEAEPFTPKTLEGYLQRVQQLKASPDRLAEIESSRTDFQDGSPEAAYQRISKALKDMTEDYENAQQAAKNLAKELRKPKTDDSGNIKNSYQTAWSSQRSQATKMLGSGILGSTDVTVLKESIKILDKYQNQAELTLEQFEELQVAATKYNELMGKGAAIGLRNIKAYKQDVKDLGADGLGKANEQLQAYQANVYRAFETKHLEQQIQKWTNLASTIGMVTSSVSILSSIGSIWENEDLTVAEKMLQTVTNLASVAGLLAPAFLASYKWIKASTLEAKLGALVAKGTLTTEQASTIQKQIQSKTLTEDNAKKVVELGLEKAITWEDTKQLALTKAKAAIEGISKFFSSPAGMITMAVAAIALIGKVTYDTIESMNNVEQEAYKKASEHAQGAAENAQELLSKYNALEQSISNLENAKDAFDKLTEGTVEWQKALADVNAQVMNLLSTYPELYQYVNNDDGVLSIDPAGLEVIKQKQLDEVNSAQAASVAAQRDARRAQIDYQRDELAEKATGGLDGDDAAALGIATAILGALGGIALTVGTAGLGGVLGAAIAGAGFGGLVQFGANRAQENDEESYKDQAQRREDKLVTAYLTMGDSILDSEETLAKALNTTADKLDATEKALLENKDAALDLIESLAQERVSADLELEQIGRRFVGQDATTGAAIAVGRRYDEEYEKALDKYADESDDDIAEAYLRSMGLSGTDFEIQDGKVSYFDGNEDVTKSIAAMQSALANIDAEKIAKTIGKEINTKFQTALMGYDSTQADILSKLASENFSFVSATRADFDALSTLSEDKLQELAEAFNLEYNILKQRYDDAVSQAQDAWSTPGNLEGEVLNKFTGVINNIDTSSLTQSLYTQFANKFAELYNRFGEEGVQALEGMLQQAGKESDDLIALLNQVDFSTDKAYSEVYKIIDDLDLGDKINRDWINEYVQQMLRLNGVYGRSAEAIAEIVKELNEIVDDLETGDVIDEEKYKDLIQKYGVDAQKLFTRLANGDYMLTGSEALLRQRKENTIDREYRRTIQAVNDRQTDLEQSAKKADTYLQYMQWAQEFANDWEAREANKLFSKNEKGRYVTNADNKQYLVGENGALTEGFDRYLRTQGYSDASIDRMLLTLRMPENAYDYQREEIESLAKNYIADNFKIYESTFYSQAQTLAAKMRPEDVGRSEQDIIDNDFYKINKERYAAYLEAFKNTSTVAELQSLVDEYNSIDEKYRQKSKIKEGEEPEFFSIDKNNIEVQKEYARLALQSYDDLTFKGAMSQEALQDYLTMQDDGIEGAAAALQKLVVGTSEYDRQLKFVSDDIESLESELDSLAGADAFENLTKQIAASNKQLALMTERLSFIKSANKDTLKSEAINMVRELDELGFVFNNGQTGDDLFSNIIDTDGNVNEGMYSQLMALQAQMIAEGKEGVADTIKEFLAAIDLYEETWKNAEKEIEEARKARQEKYFSAYEKWFDGITAKEKATQKINDFTRNFLDDDDFSARTDTFIKDLEASDSLIADIEAGFKENEELFKQNKISQAQYLENYESLVEQLQDEYLNAYEAIQAIEEERLNALNAISEAYQQQIDYIEQINDLIDVQKNMQELIYGDNADLSGYYNMRAANAKSISEAAAARYEAAQKAYNELDPAELADPKNEAIVKEYAEAGKAAADAFFNELETGQEQFQYNIQKALKTFTDNVWGGQDMELWAEEWQWAQAQSDKYFDSVERRYQMDQLGYMFDRAVADTNNLKAQQRINELRKQELTYLDKYNNLSETQVKLAQQKLDILLAEMALEDARASKTQMRLMRGADGTYSYQYVADDSAIAEAEEKLSKAESDLHSSQKDASKEAISDIYDGYQDLMDLVERFAGGEEGWSEEEKRIIQERYEAWLKSAEDANLTNDEYFKSLSSTVTTYAQGSGDNINKMIQESSGLINNAMTTFKTAWSQLWNGDEGLNNALSTFTTTATGTTKKVNELLTGSKDGNGNNGLIGAIKNIVAAYDGEDGYIAYLEKEYDTINKIWGTLNGEDGLIKKYEDWAVKVGDLAKKYETLADKKALAEKDAPSKLVDTYKEGREITMDFGRGKAHTTSTYTSTGTAAVDDLGEIKSINTVLDSQGREQYYLTMENGTIVSASSYAEAKGMSVQDIIESGGEQNIKYSKGTSESTPTIKEKDSDGDGVPDSKGAYPNDKLFQSEVQTKAWHGSDAGGKLNYYGSGLWDNNDVTRTSYFNSQVDMLNDTGATIDTKDSDGNYKDLKLNEKYIGQVWRDQQGNKYIAVSPVDDENVLWYAKSHFLSTYNTTLWGLGESYWGSGIFTKSFDTGGYTGAWGDSSGKLAMLHEKEIVLNKTDTANLLQAVDVVRSLETSMLNSLSRMSMGTLSSSAAWELAKEMVIEQNVHIDASFPNVSVKGEIEEAFNELINMATQYIHSK